MEEESKKDQTNPNPAEDVKEAEVEVGNGKTEVEKPDDERNNEVTAKESPGVEVKKDRVEDGANPESSQSEVESSNKKDENEDQELVIDEESNANNVIPNPNPAAKTEDEEEEEDEFQLTAEDMINDIDDEQTLEEEEALNAENAEEAAKEAAKLNEEADMPLEDLLKMYGYKNNDEESGQQESEQQQQKESESTAQQQQQQQQQQQSSPKAGEKRLHEEDEDDDDEDEDKSGASNHEEIPPKKSKSDLARFYEATVEGRSLRSQGNPNNPNPDDDEDSDEVQDDPNDSDYEGRDFSWKKTIMIGPSYQASVPIGLSSYDDTPPYENEDKLLWDPKNLNNTKVEDFLAKSQEALQPSGVGGLPLGAHIRDDEQSLHMLLMCGFNYEEALRRRRMNAVPPAETMSLWSEEECRAFELGLRLYGKDFHMIQQQKVRTRSVGELVQFYYLWKKTERHDVFANATRLEKKKYALHPGITDYMDRFIDEQDGSNPNSDIPSYHSLLYNITEAAATTRSKGLLMNKAEKEEDINNVEQQQQQQQQHPVDAEKVSTPANGATLAENLSAETVNPTAQPSADPSPQTTAESASVTATAE